MSAPSKPRILVVEDDDNLRIALVDNLEDEGYQVDGADRGQAGVRMAADASYDLVILDIMLPDLDGYAVCKQLRSDGYEGAVLMLTARTLEDDVIAGFDVGADDYLAKPYRLRELLARVKALLRRQGVSAVAGDTENFDGVALDRAARTVTRADGQLAELTRTEFDLLLFLYDRRGQALSRLEILEQVWGDVVVDPRTVDNFVSSLKRKLDWSADRKFAFKAVRGVGYRFELRAESAQE